MEAALMKRLCQIVGTTEMNVSSFKENDKPFLEIIKAVYGLPIINGTKEGVTRKKEQLHNVKAALKFLQRVKVDTKSIKAEDVLQGSIQLVDILYRIFLHYLIKKLPEQRGSSDPINVFLQWIKQRMHGIYDIRNFKSDWKNGMALGALLSAYGVPSEWRSFKALEKDYNVSHLMKLAEDELEIQQIIEVTDMTNECPDQDIIVLYLSQFIEVQCSPSAVRNAGRKPTQKRDYESAPCNPETRNCMFKSTDRWKSEPDKNSTELSTIPYTPCERQQEYWQQLDKCHVNYKKLVQMSMTDIEVQRGESVKDGGNRLFKARFTHPGNGREPVIVKLPHSSDMKAIEDLMREAYFLICFKHKNLIPLLGLTLCEGWPCLILPFYKNGNLSTYLERNQGTDNNTLLKFAIDITEGLKYIADKGYVYGNLRARNCLVTDQLTVVLTEFDFTGDVFCKDYVVEDPPRLPAWRWFAVELLAYGLKFTKETDVWGLGVVLYEVFSRGDEPYADVGDQVQLYKKLVEGGRLPKPQTCPDHVYELMKRCWDVNPKGRPSLDEILTELRETTVETDVKQFDLPPGGSTRWNHYV